MNGDEIICKSYLGLASDPVSGNYTVCDFTQKAETAN